MSCGDRGRPTYAGIPIVESRYRARYEVLLGRGRKLFHTGSRATLELSRYEFARMVSNLAFDTSEPKRVAAWRAQQDARANEGVVFAVLGSDVKIPPLKLGEFGP